MKKIFDIYRNILMIVAILLATVMILPLAFQVKPYIVLSGSMEPTINAGDVCYIKEYKENEKPEVGSIVAFVLNDNETMFVHRVVNINGNKYITQGDANDSLDLYTPTDESIVGYPVFVIPYFGTIVSWMQSPKGIIVMIIAVLISVLSSFIEDEKKEKKKKDKNELKKIKIEENEEMIFEEAGLFSNEKKNNTQTLAEIVKQQKDEFAIVLERENNKWEDELFDGEFMKMSELNNNKPSVEKSDSLFAKIYARQKNSEYRDLKERTETWFDTTEQEEDVEYDFENMSVEKETRKIVEKYSAEASAKENKEKGTNYEELAKIGLKSFADDDTEFVDNTDELFDITKYTDKYLGEEALNITEDTLLFETDGVSINENNWTFMVDDEDDSPFAKMYKESVMNSVKRKLESDTYNEADNFSPMAIIKRAQEAMIDDLSEDEENIMKQIMREFDSSSENASDTEETLDLKIPQKP